MTAYPPRTHDFLTTYGFDHPIIQAPMAGAVTSPDLIVAVSEAGGMGSHGAAYMTPEQLDTVLAATRERTTKPFSVNLFCARTPPMPVWDDNDPAIAQCIALYAQNGLEPPRGFAEPHDDFDAKIDSFMRHKVPVVSFVFGIPPRSVFERIRAYGGAVWLTASNPGEARLCIDAQPDAIILQGHEAGGHRAVFDPDTMSAITTRDVLDAVRAETDIPLIAAGGLMNGRDVADVLKAGAAAAQLGTAFLACDESGINTAWRHALLTRTDTIVTRSFSGRPARGFPNAHTDAFKAMEDALPPFPYTNDLTRALRNHARDTGNPEYQSLWAGQNVAHARALPARTLMETLIKELKEA